MFGKKIDPAATDVCPLMGCPCIKERCKWSVQIAGKNPQSGREVDLRDCAIAWMPVLILEGAKETRQAAAAVESFRNESVKSTNQLTGVMAEMGRLAQIKLIRDKGDQ